MIAVDTSIVVAAFASWHELHDRACEVVNDDVRLVAHCAYESYSVLTRLPPPHRAPADLVATFLHERFPGAWLTLPPRKSRALIERLASSGIRGGAAYDALVAATAAHAGATLVSCDRRARVTYAAVGVDYELVA